MEYISNRVISLLINNDIIEKEDEVIYVYGLEVLLNLVTILLLIILLGVFIEQELKTFIFLFFYCLLRGCGGGYHANNYFRCCICSISVYIIVIIAGLWVTPIVKYSIFIPLILFGDLILFITAPSQNRKNPRTIKEISKFRRRMLISLIVTNILTVICWQFNLLDETYFTICCTVFIVAILSMINYIQNHIIERM